MTKTKHRGITKLGKNRYRVRVRGVNPSTGQMEEVKRVVEGGVKEVKRLRDELYERIKSGGIAKQERTKVKTYARSWLAARIPRVKEGTAIHYATVFDYGVTIRLSPCNSVKS